MKHVKRNERGIMINLDIAHQRLHNQLITQRRFEKPGDVVQWLGASKKHMISSSSMCQVLMLIG